ncbi:MAG: peptidase T [Brevinema sp.]
MINSKRLVERFLRYVAIPSQSSFTETTLPSSPGQMELAKLLQSELKTLGLSDIKLTDKAILTARLKGNKPNAPVVGYITHLDTFDGGFSPVIKPQIIRYEGGDVVLNSSKNIVLRTAEHPEVLAYKGQEIIFTDGTSVLGADDKAAVAVVMETIQTLIENKDVVAHGDLVFAFVPDEEIGLKGAQAMDLADFPADFAYTLDCCELGEVVFENVNSAAVHLKIEGVTAHPMSAKGVMVNPILVGVDFVNMFDRKDTPECVDGRDGAFWQKKFEAGFRTCTIEMSIADFDATGFASRKEQVRGYVDKLKQMHPKAKIEMEIRNRFLNMGEGIGDDRLCVDLIYECMEKCKIIPKTTHMRGGTDGSDLSHRGIPTPNYFTGAHNFHSVFEFLPIPSFEKALELTLTIIQTAGNLSK